MYFVRNDENKADQTITEIYIYNYMTCYITSSDLRTEKRNKIDAY